MPHFLAKSSLFSGVLGIILKRIGQIPVLRASAQAGDSLAYAKQALAKGQTVVIYPEGTLTKDPQMWPQHFRPAPPGRPWGPGPRTSPPPTGGRTPTFRPGASGCGSGP